tara:strand:- start:7900 stop:8079 length:180 start_codon:yes stop_codon:yes gene_type:complete
MDDLFFKVLGTGTILGGLGIVYYGMQGQSSPIPEDLAVIAGYTLAAAGFYYGYIRGHDE